MPELTDDEDLPSLTRFELVSDYVEGYSKASPERRAALERELARRGLPLPSITPCPSRERSEQDVAPRISRRSFLAYLLLLYVVTGFVYAWIYLLERVLRRDFAEERQHKIILSLISLVYVLAEALLAYLLLEA